MNQKLPGDKFLKEMLIDILSSAYDLWQIQYGESSPKDM